MLMDAPYNLWPRSGRSLSSLCLISIAILAAHGCDSRFVDSDELVEVRGQIYLDGEFSRHFPHFTWSFQLILLIKKSLDLGKNIPVCFKFWTQDTPETRPGGVPVL